MPTPTWPATLPQNLLMGVTRKRQAGKLRSEMDTGPAKQRQRFTARVTQFQDGAQVMTGAQLAIFDTFYDDDLGAGTLSFNWIDPFTDDACLLRFMGEPDATCINPASDPDDRLYRVTLPLERLP